MDCLAQGYAAAEWRRALVLSLARVWVAPSRDSRVPEASCAPQGCRFQELAWESAPAPDPEQRLPVWAAKSFQLVESFALVWKLRSAARHRPVCSWALPWMLAAHYARYTVINPRAASPLLDRRGGAKRRGGGSTSPFL